ncbi:UNVERIFIED_CONTAM: hypothetical protein K2H54_060518 [Gekko kuhli]
MFRTTSCIPSRSQVAKDVKHFYDEALTQAQVHGDQAPKAKTVVKTFHDTHDCHFGSRRNSSPICCGQAESTSQTPLWPGLDRLLSAATMASPEQVSDTIGAAGPRVAPGLHRCQACRTMELDCCGTSTVTAAASYLTNEKLCSENFLQMLTVQDCHSRIDELFSGKLYLIGIAAIVVAVIMIFEMILSMVLCCGIRSSVY